jgi:hypothetical protein
MRWNLSLRYVGARGFYSVVFFLLSVRIPTCSAVQWHASPSSGVVVSVCQLEIYSVMEFLSKDDGRPALLIRFFSQSLPHHHHSACRSCSSTECMNNPRTTCMHACSCSALHDLLTCRCNVPCNKLTWRPGQGHRVVCFLACIVSKRTTQNHMH